ncbi:MAG: aminotransferase class I/II-fold pyridoxal phosphate-dependent enzyme [Bdellovibrionales bacterium]
MFNIALKSLSKTASKRTKARLAFLKSCSKRTTIIQRPIANPFASHGHANPAELGNAELFSRKGSWGQCSVLFPDMATDIAAYKSGKAPYGGAEYGITLTPEADAICQKMAALHGGVGAILCPSGLSAITTTIAAFAPQTILFPRNVYYPMLRFLEHRKLHAFSYPNGASADEVAALVKQALAIPYAPENIMIYIEAPGSGTFEIPDIDGIVALAKKKGIRTVMDNAWASHVRYKPLEHGIDVVIQATTKYEGGYGDTPSGVVIAGNAADYKILYEELKVSGNGAIAPTTCARLSARIDSTKQRMNEQYATALQLAKWFLKQPFVEAVLSPALKTSPYYARFKKYFGKGNGLFSVIFKENIPSEKINAFIDALNLFWIAASWGGHVSLVLPVPRREPSSLPPGKIVRFHAGLEDPRDLLRDVQQAAQKVFTEEQKPKKPRHAKSKASKRRR